LVFRHTVLNPMYQLVQTYDNPTTISDWLSFYPLGETGVCDSLGNRIQKAQGAVITKYIVDPNSSLPSVLAEADASGNIHSYYVYGLGLISKIEGNNAYFYQYDGIGSTVAMTDVTGPVVNQYAYDDFGNLANNSSETIANPFKYVGKFGVATDAPDLLFMRARYYSPSLGRFINKDPIGLRGGLNLYGYVGSNVLRFIDPLGFGGAGGSWCNNKNVFLGQISNIWNSHVQWHRGLRKSVADSGPYGQGGPYIVLGGVEIVGLGTTLSGVGLTGIAGGGIAGVVVGGGWTIVGIEIAWIGIDVIGGYNDSLRER